MTPHQTDPASIIALRHLDGTHRLVMAELNLVGVAIVAQPGVKQPASEYMLIHSKSGRPFDARCQHLTLDMAIQRFEQLQALCAELGVDLTLNPDQLDKPMLHDILAALD